MFCEHCGNKSQEESKFCVNCGKPPLLYSTQENISKPEHIKSSSFSINKQFWSVGVACAVAVLIIGLSLFFSQKNVKDISSSLQGEKSKNNMEAVVDILCDNDKGGSGTIFTTDGTILTNNHVIADAKSCKITIPDPSTGGIASIYEATPIVVPELSKKYDVATLKINASYTDDKGKTWGSYPAVFSAFTSPSTCSTSSPSQLNDSIRIYGYPVTSGGYNLTVTDGILSSFADNGKILTSAKIDSGNSGGLAVDQNGCWLGIPSAVVAGNYQNLGVIIPGNIVESFLNNVPTKLNPVEKFSNSNTVAESAVNPEKTDDQRCQGTFGTNSEASGVTDSKGRPSCVCKTGYTWDSTGNACASRKSLSLYCENNYGAGSYSSSASGRAICGCSSGYQLNNEGSLCVATPSSLYDDTKAGNVSGCVDNAQYSRTTGLSCSGNGTCSSGSFLDKDTGQCSTPIAYCQNMYGVNASYDLASNSCGCSVNYTLNSTKTSCVDKNNGYRVCNDLYPNETWDGTYGSSGKYNCVCVSGYHWSTYANACL